MKERSQVNTGRLLAYALPVIPLSMMMGPIGAILPAFYAKHTAISLASIGTALFLIRLFDAVTDQLVGYLSDVTESPFGRRKPWLAGGVLVSALSVYFLYAPPPTAGFGYFFTSIFFLYLGWTLIAVPHLAWGSELSRDYRQRTRISSFHAFLGPLGFALIMAVPLLPVFENSEMTPDAIFLMGVIVMISLPLFIVPCLVFAPQTEVTAAGNPSVRDLFNAVRGNRPFWLFVAVLLLIGSALGMLATCIVLYMDSFLGIGDKISHVMIVNMGALLASVPLWVQVVYRLGKHGALALSCGLNIIVIPVVLLIPPGQDSFVPFTVWMAAVAMAGGATTVVPMSILGDVIDYDTLKSGANRAGNYFALMGFVQKAAAAIGGGVAFYMLSFFSFDAKSASQTEMAVFGLKFSMVGLPVLITVIAVILVLKFPLDARRHDIIRRRLDQRKA
ncbi:MFS transporter [Emcibacter nanhaiensis]|uniref:MFS transporter n=1 Tax=Emcibacter nanhaiensis TaxID=1505037 RepID=A0A501PH55_9PROT|nr:MFS transporter [Emcibacter nanhaiensis]TPD59284.1 MFS transporter [Emcibacter nanhaiensis]